MPKVPKLRAGEDRSPHEGEPSNMDSVPADRLRALWRADEDREAVYGRLAEEYDEREESRDPAHKARKQNGRSGVRPVF